MLGSPISGKPPFLEIGETVDEVDDPAGARVEEERIDGEVAARRILGGGAESVVIGDEERLIALLLRRRRLSESCRLDDVLGAVGAAEDHVGQLESAPDDPAVAEEAADLARAGARRDVEIFGWRWSNRSRTQPPTRYASKPALWSRSTTRTASGSSAP